MLDLIVILAVHALAEDIIADQYQAYCNCQNATNYESIQLCLHGQPSRHSFHPLVLPSSFSQEGTGSA